MTEAQQNKGLSPENTGVTLDRTFSIAPMMDCDYRSGFIVIFHILR